jgi:hypothetical protein
MGSLNADLKSDLNELANSNCKNLRRHMREFNVNQVKLVISYPVSVSYFSGHGLVVFAVY